MAHQHDVAYATLVMTDSYLPGAMVLGHSLKDRGAKARLAALVLIDKLSIDTINELQTVYDDIIPVEQMVNMQPANLYLMGRPDLISTFTKIELWKQTQYKRLVYLDADIVVLRAPNELLTMETNFAAVPDVGWPDCFNSGMMVLNPNMGDYYSLQALANRGISFDGADQGLLNMHFTEWERLSFVYNCTPNANYQYVPAYKHFQSGIIAVHFIGAEKPWTLGRDHRTNSGVYGELLARWWSVYDRHYRRPNPVSYSQFTQPQKKVQDYVRGEETRYEPAPPSKTGNQAQNLSGSQNNAQSRERRNSSGYSITQPNPAPVPGIYAFSSSADSSAMERPFGDQPSVSEKIDQDEYTPTTTQEQRRWSAPHAEWEPARQPPPTDSKPEAANFPTQQYEMSDSTQFFEAPIQYPEPPKDMWYEVPSTKPTPTAPPRHIFPWEERTQKATRVFPKSREPTPPPVEQAAPTASASTSSNLLTSDSQKDVPSSTSDLSQAVSNAFSQPDASNNPLSPPQHVFPWESRAPKPTRVFPANDYLNPPTETSVAEENQIDVPGRDEPKGASRDNSIGSNPSDNPWDAFSQQSNKWDEDPDIAKFMESFNKPRRAPVQVVHDSRTLGDSNLPITERRTSLKLTDFPTEVERPSLPVTPAPIRRPSFWGTDEQDGSKSNILPVARGVPRQDEWNPIIRLEELQRKQSLIMSNEDEGTRKAHTPPQRVMPGSQSAEEAVAAAMKAMTVSHDKPRGPIKPILREPHFEVTKADDTDLANENLIATAHMTATGSKSPTRFNPIVLEGVAASQSTTYFDSDPLLSEGEDANPVTHKSSSSGSAVSSFHAAATVSPPADGKPAFDYSSNSLSPTLARRNLTATPSDTVPGKDVISPTTSA